MAGESSKRNRKNSGQLKVNGPVAGQRILPAIGVWLDELGKTDADKLRQIANLSTEDKINLGKVLTEVFNDYAEEQIALKRFTSLKLKVNEVAAEHGIAYRLEADTKKQSPASSRFCWFTGTDPAVESAEDLSEKNARIDAVDAIGTSRAIRSTPEAMVEGKRVVRFFVSYAHDDEPQQVKLLENLRLQFAPSKRYELDLWADKRIELGNDWHEEIKRALNDCDFGMLLVSPGFLGSAYIEKNELPRFIPSDENVVVKPVVPVGLKPVDFGLHDLHGLKERQIFRYQSRWFSECGSTTLKEAFALELFRQIEAKLDRWFESRGVAEIQKKPANRASRNASRNAPKNAQTDDDCLSTQRAEQYSHHAATQYMPGGSFQPSKAAQGVFDANWSLAQVASPAMPTGAVVEDVVKEMMLWSAEDDAPPYLAVLGEYGIGKTTSLKKLALNMIEKRKSDPSVRLPLYFDLRDLADDKTKVPLLDDLLNELITRSWNAPNRSRSAAKDLIRLVREERAVVIFDGLDERIIHLSKDNAKAFVRELWSILPPSMHTLVDADGKSKRNPNCGRIIFSCRSHYFRDVKEQASVLTGGGRDGDRKSDFHLLILLPFEESQIRNYLLDVLGSKEKADAAFGLIQSIHNLGDLVKRPYLLNLIGNQLGALEQLRAGGKTVDAARLYEEVASSWLDRDLGKHQLNPVHKRLLMERLALELWRAGNKIDTDTKSSWNADRLELWFDNFLYDNPQIASSYPDKSRDVLKEDLRVATFLVRPENSRDRFQFAHTSLQEFFLASALVRAAENGDRKAWDCPKLSHETMAFLGQLISHRDADQRRRCLATIEAILGEGIPQAARTAFQYWMDAMAHDLPSPNPPHVNLHDADLEDLRLEGKPNGWLNFSRANLRGVKLNRARLRYVDCSGADFTGAELRQLEVSDFRGDRANFSDADLRRSVWRQGSTANVEMNSDAGNGVTQLAGSQWIAVQQAPVTTKIPDHTPDWHALVQAGHSSSVTSVSWSPDGRLLASGSWDNTVRVWDVEAGRQTAVFQGHENRVTSVSWSPDGLLLASGSFDNTVRVWDVEAGRQTAVFQGHENWVTSVSWSPDGRLLASGSFDKTVRVWDVEAGRQTAVFQGHENWVASVSWSPDGRLLASGSFDKTVRVWDVQTSRQTAVFQGHEKVVTSVSWSPDGRLLASGSNDKTVRVWDVQARRQTALLKGHKNLVTSVSWSPDGRLLASGSDDKTVRVWDVQTSRQTAVFQGHENWVTSVSWSPDGRLLASGSNDKTVRVWDVEAGRQTAVFQGHENVVTSVSWSPDGRLLASGSDDNTVRVWDVEAGRQTAVFQGHENWVTSVSWSPDGRLLASGSWDKTVRVWDVQTSRQTAVFQGHENWVASVSWSPDGRLLASGSGDDTVRVWDVEAGRQTAVFQGHEARVSSVSWSPDGTRLASGSYDKTVRVWDVDAGRQTAVFQGHENAVSCVSWSPDGLHLASGSDDKTVRVWDVQAGREIQVLKENDPKPDWFERKANRGAAKVIAVANVIQVTDDAGQPLLHFAQLPENEWATINGDQTKFVQVSPNAWRWLSFVRPVPNENRFEILPAEAFGELTVH